MMNFFARQLSLHIFATELYTIKSEDMANQSEDFRWFVKNHDAILEKYDGKFVVVSGKEIKASANTVEEGIEKALDLGLSLGSFIVQLCTEGDEAYTQRFYSRAIFA